MDKKNIWIVNEYAGNPRDGMTLRHFYLAEAFNNEGFNTTIVSGSFSHILTELPKIPKGKSYYKELIHKVSFLWIKVFPYKGATHYKRILKWFYFSWKLLFVSKYIKHKPDYIICSPTAPFCFASCYYLAQKHKAKLVFEVRDIWPQSLINIGNFSPKHPFIVFMKRFELFAIKKADLLVSNLQHYNTYLAEQGINRKAVWISNGISLKEKKKTVPLPLSIKEQIPQDKFIVGYTGKLGISNAMEYFIDAALLCNNKAVHFVVVGQGEEKEKLVQKAHQASNVTFILPIPKQEIPDMIAQFNVCYLGWKNESLYDYGISPNKIYDYMYAAKPIIHSFHVKKEWVTLAQCGIRVDEENPQEILQAIDIMYQMPKDELKKLGENGKEFVLKELTYTQLAKKYIVALQGLD